METQVEKNKQILKRLIDEAFNSRKLDVLEEILHPDFVNHQEIFPLKAKKGPAVFHELYSAFFDFFSDVKADYTHVISEGDYIVARDFITGTNDGEMMGNPPTGKKVKFEVFHLYRVEGDQLIERWGLTDDLSLGKQLGTIKQIIIMSQLLIDRGSNLLVTAALGALVENDVETVFDFTVAEDVVTKFLKGEPAVTGYEIMQGPWGQPGAFRWTYFGKDKAREQVNFIQRPYLFDYQLTEYTSELKDLVDLAVAQFLFRPVGPRTEIKLVLHLPTVIRRSTCLSSKTS